MSELSRERISAIASAYIGASRANDADTLRALAAPGAVTWHNFDGLEVPTESTIRTVAWLHRTVPDIDWHEVALRPTADGFVWQATMTGTAPGGPLLAHTCIVATLGADGLITRVEEYLDPRQTAVLRA